MKSLGERLLELREKCAVDRDYRLQDAMLEVPAYDLYDFADDCISSLHLWRVVAIERAAVRELRKEGKL
jgi:hypothetical protein